MGQRAHHRAIEAGEIAFITSQGKNNWFHRILFRNRTIQKLRHREAPETPNIISILFRSETKFDRAHGRALSSTGSADARLTSKGALQDRSLSKLDRRRKARQ